MKRTTPFLVAALIVLSISTAEAYKPADIFTDQNGDKRHVKTGRVYRRYSSLNDSRKNMIPNEGGAFEIAPHRSLKVGMQHRFIKYAMGATASLWKRLHFVITEVPRLYIHA